MNTKYLAVLGRERELSLAELERLYGEQNLKAFGHQTALLGVRPDINLIGGSPKTAEVVKQFEFSSEKDLIYEIELVAHELLAEVDKKARLGISSYSDRLSLQTLKPLTINISKGLRKAGKRLRAVPNREPELNAGQVWHNRLDRRPNLELVIATDGNQAIIARTIGIQDIESYTKRDRHKPVRDTLVGMLPPKLARQMINLASPKDGGVLLDPFCGTGTVLMEALLMGQRAIGSDISAKMVQASTDNVDWLLVDNGIGKNRVSLSLADAQTATWPRPIEAVVSETYLGPPLSQLPPSSHLQAIVYEVDGLLRSTLQNLARQLKPATPLCLAIPAWHDLKAGRYRHLPLVDDLASLGYNLVDFKSVSGSKLIYRRPDQTVARQILVITRK